MPLPLLLKRARSEEGCGGDDDAITRDDAMRRPSAARPTHGPTGGKWGEGGGTAHARRPVGAAVAFRSSACRAVFRCLLSRAGRGLLGLRPRGGGGRGRGACGGQAVVGWTGESVCVHPGGSERDCGFRRSGLHMRTAAVVVVRLSGFLRVLGRCLLAHAQWAGVLLLLHPFVMRSAAATATARDRFLRLGCVGFSAYGSACSGRIDCRHTFTPR